MKANIGMMYPVFAPISAYTPGSAITYGDGAVIQEAVSANIAWERSDNHFYGDDVELDNDNGILGYTITFEPSGLSDAARAILLGEVTDSSSGIYEITGDAAPEGGFGYIRVMRAENSNGRVVNTYDGWWFHKVRCGISAEETRTKERQIEWRVPTIEAVGSGVIVDESEKLKFAKHKNFATAALAKAWLNGLANIT